MTPSLRLNLQRICNAAKPVREKLDIRPPLPVDIRQYDRFTWGVDSIIAALERNDRACQVQLWHISGSQ